MSTAVIISGQMRTFSRCYPTQRWHVYRHYEPDIHFFVSCVDDKNADSAELLRQHYANVHIEKWEDPDDLPEIPLELGAHAPYANAASHHQLMLQHWGNKRAWEFMWERMKHEITAVIRMRPDNFFHRFVPCEQPSWMQAYTPWWGKFGGINDRFAVMGGGATFSYFNVLDKIDGLIARGCPFHPESLVAASLADSGCNVNTSLQAFFSTLRTTGDQRWLEICPADLAELIANR
jgi:hypothetical protein